MSYPYLSTLKTQLGELERKIAETELMLKDPELKELARQELESLKKQRASLLKSIVSIEQGKTAGSQSSGGEIRDVIIEIRAAAGGDEAGLFAYNLYRMYLKFAESQKWKTRQLSIKEGGIGNIKEVCFEVTASKSAQTSPYSLLKLESGVHRVQRIPITESSGRIHTSTATVAVLPKVKETQLEIKPEDIEVNVFRASGPGGQHVNKTESAVRVIHKPSGIVVSCQESRSQLKNRESALNILRARLYQRQQEEKLQQMDEKRRQQIGSGERAEKIRTYNFPQDRVTDHRLKKSWHHIDKIMDGEIMPILTELCSP